MIIPVVFCFDNNFAPYAYITIKSLSFYAKEETRYSVYCVVNNDLTSSNKKHILSLSNKNLDIQFIQAKKTFEKAHQHRGITESSYYRLMLHDLIPHQNKVIYLDVDVLINEDLTQFFSIYLGKNIIGGVKNLYIHQVFEKHLINIDYWEERFKKSKYTYINAGVLLMNLEQIRTTEIWKEWVELAKYKWEYHDQDILNISCMNKVLFLPPKYNATYPIRAKGADFWDLFTSEELAEKPVIFHFTASKPWDSKYMNQSQVWWAFVKNHTEEYNYYLNRYNKLDSINKKMQRLVLKGKRIFAKIIRSK